MLTRIIGMTSLGWGVAAFLVSSSIPIPPEASSTINSGVNITVVGLFAGWLVSSGLVKLGMILHHRWTRAATISTLLFIFALLNVGALTRITTSTPAPTEGLPYVLLSSWLSSWFWIDAFCVFSALFGWIARRRQLS